MENCFAEDVESTDNVRQKARVYFWHDWMARQKSPLRPSIFTCLLSKEILLCRTPYLCRVRILVKQDGCHLHLQVVEKRLSELAWKPSYESSPNDLLRHVHPQKLRRGLQWDRFLSCPHRIASSHATLQPTTVSRLELFERNSPRWQAWTQPRTLRAIGLNSAQVVHFCLTPQKLRRERTLVRPPTVFGATSVEKLFYTWSLLAIMYGDLSLQDTSSLQKALWMFEQSSVYIQNVLYSTSTYCELRRGLQNTVLKYDYQDIQRAATRVVQPRKNIFPRDFCQNAN